MVRIGTTAKMTTATVFVALLLALLFVSQPSVASLQIDDHAVNGFTLESAYVSDEISDSEANTPDYEHPDFLKSAAFKLPESNAQWAAFRLVLTISNVDSVFGNIRAPPVLS